jgi:hypothetical protein
MRYFSNCQRFGVDDDYDNDDVMMMMTMISMVGSNVLSAGKNVLFDDDYENDDEHGGFKCIIRRKKGFIQVLY